MAASLFMGPCRAPPCAQPDPIIKVLSMKTILQIDSPLFLFQHSCMSSMHNFANRVFSFKNLINISILVLIPCHRQPVSLAKETASDEYFKCTDPKYDSYIDVILKVISKKKTNQMPLWCLHRTALRQ